MFIGIKEYKNKPYSKSNPKHNTINFNQKLPERKNTENKIPKTQSEKINESRKKQKQSNIKNSNINIVANELSCSLSNNELTDLLEEILYTQIEMVCYNQYSIKTLINISSNSLIKLFINHNIVLKYFRNISQSTWRLFNTEK